MREIEIKIKLDDQQEEMLRGWLAVNAKKVNEVKHIEYYFNNKNKSFLFESKQGYIDATDYLRVRITEKGSSVCLKKFSIDLDTGKSRNIDEIETSVSDGEETVKLLENLGFNKSITIDKNRESFQYDSFAIEIDEVEGLGKFAEFEVSGVSEDEDIAVGFKLIKDLFKKIGFNEYLECSRGYVSMLWNPNHDFSILKNLN
jgi:predicted adenylyl cyclase CyaB